MVSGFTVFIIMIMIKSIFITKLCSLITAIFGLSKSLMLVCVYIFFLTFSFLIIFLSQLIILNKYLMFYTKHFRAYESWYCQFSIFLIAVLNGHWISECWTDVLRGNTKLGSWGPLSQYSQDTKGIWMDGCYVTSVLSNSVRPYGL